MKLFVDNGEGPVDPADQVERRRSRRWNWQPEVPYWVSFRGNIKELRERRPDRDEM